MADGIGVRVVFDRFPEVGSTMRRRADAAVAKTALDIEGGVKAGIQSFGLIDTGAMLNSTQARQLAPGRWLVEVGQGYAIYHVLGTRYLPARDFWHPPIERARSSFLAAMHHLVGA